MAATTNAPSSVSTGTDVLTTSSTSAITPTSISITTSTSPTSTASSIFTCPCLNDGICQTDENDFVTCQCVNGYTGEICQNPPTTQPTNSPTTISSTTVITPPCPCLNNGVCETSSYGLFGCTCVNGYSGYLCQIPPLTTTQSSTPTTVLSPTSTLASSGNCIDHLGTSHNNGDTWALQGSSCISYICQSGVISAVNTCTSTETSTPSPPMTTESPAISCVSPTGNQIPHGQFYYFNSCLKYLCVSGTVQAYNNCDDQVLIDDGVCYHNGWYFYNYQQWEVSYNGVCSKYTCTEGYISTASCDEPTPSPTNSPTPTANEAPRCVDENGQTYSHGAIWYKDNCFGFSCYMGNINAFNNCPTSAPAPTNTYSPGSCIFNNKRYNNGESWYKENCHSYLCTNGNVTVFNHCHTPTQISPTNPPATFCYGENGYKYYHGQIWTKDECNHYICQNGTIETVNICLNGSPGETGKSCWMCDANSWEECLEIGQASDIRLTYILFDSFKILSN